MKEVELEKELYFGKLSQLDQYLGELSGNPEIQGNSSPVLQQIMSQINSILFQEERPTYAPIQASSAAVEVVEELLNDEAIAATTGEDVDML